MFHIVLCDDDSMFIKYLTEVMKKAGLKETEAMFYKYLSGEELIANLNKQLRCDLLILDMQMDKLDGHETAAKFREHFPKSVLVYCSGVHTPTDESFKAIPFRYLLKSYSEEKMICELECIIEEMKLKCTGPVIIGKYYYNIVQVKAEDILYIENIRNGSHIYVRSDSVEYSYDKSITSDKKLAQQYEILHDYGFEYAHNSYIVNLSYVVRMQSNGEITLIDGTRLNVARSKLKTFRTAFAEWNSKKYK